MKIYIASFFDWMSSGESSEKDRIATRRECLALLDNLATCPIDHPTRTTALQSIAHSPSSIMARLLELYKDIGAEEPVDGPIDKTVAAARKILLDEIMTRRELRDKRVIRSFRESKSTAVGPAPCR